VALLSVGTITKVIAESRLPRRRRAWRGCGVGGQRRVEIGFPTGARPAATAATASWAMSTPITSLPRDAPATMLAQLAQSDDRDRQHHRVPSILLVGRPRAQRPNARL
jgi:hypothetical protein